MENDTLNAAMVRAKQVLTRCARNYARAADGFFSEEHASEEQALAYLSQTTDLLVEAALALADAKAACLARGLELATCLGCGIVAIEKPLVSGLCSGCTGSQS